RFARLAGRQGGVEVGWGPRAILPAIYYGAVSVAERRLGNRLKEARAEHGLTQADLALRAGVSRKTINTIENGVFTPSALLALVLARELEMSVEALFFLTTD
ncbi:MAG: transcriptional regulator, partial [Caulobacteraceae bacterium]|nr:transcriptional regulator [Caulobacteraceae bacterium]